MTDKLNELERRLNDGWGKINKGIEQGVDVNAWTEFWLSLLHEYEKLSDELWGLTPKE